MPHNAQNKKNSFFAIAVILLAVAVAYLATAIWRTTTELPSIAKTIDGLQQSVPGVLQEASAYRELIPEVNQQIAAVSQAIPPLLERIESVQKQVERLEASVPALVNSNLPAIYQRVDQLQLQVEALQSQLPGILSTVDQSSNVLAATNKQIEASLSALPDVLAEVRAVRAELPVLLSRAEALVGEAQTVSEDAGKGMFKGLVKGIVSTPFDLLSAPAKLFSKELENAKEFNEQDLDLMFQAATRLLSDNKLKVVEWRNPQSGASGQVELVRNFQQSGRACKQLQFDAQSRKGVSDKLIKNICLNQEGKWQAVE